VEYVNVIAMDFKLPSSSPAQPELWREHEKFLSKTRDREVIIKAVITDTTNIDDIKKFGRILAGSGKDVSVILQPVTIINDTVKAPDREMVDIFKAYLIKETAKNVAVLGQFHKVLGIR
jgi:organic radical activating enzyme